MTRLPRRLLLWGGAAAIASGGFAFMASNSLAASSAGDGTGSVTGYNVSTITYTPQDTSGTTLLGAVEFTITSKCGAPTTCTAAHAEPKTVSMYTEKITGATKTVYGPLLYWQRPGTFGRPDGTFGGATYLFGKNATTAQMVNSCTLTGTWTATHGSGQFTCRYERASKASNGYYGTPIGGEAGPHFSTFTNIDVEANQ